MFRASDLVIDAFVKRLRTDYEEMFAAGRPEHVQTLETVARASLSRIARSNALYHNVDHTVLVTLAGEDMLRGRIIRDGDVSAQEWVQFVSALLCFAIGFVRDICPMDCGKICQIDERGTTIALTRGATDGALWPHFVERSKIFVRHRFANDPVLDADRMAAAIEYGRFPPLPDRNLETDTYPGLLRAAHVIGAVADPGFMLKLKPLLQELQESGIAGQLGYRNVADLRLGYPKLFWEILYPRIVDAVELLRLTGSGRAWLANMHKHVLVEEHREFAIRVAAD